MISHITSMLQVNILCSSPRQKSFHLQEKKLSSSQSPPRHVQLSIMQLCIVIICVGELTYVLASKQWFVIALCDLVTDVSCVRVKFMSRFYKWTHNGRTTGVRHSTNFWVFMARHCLWICEKVCGICFVLMLCFAHVLTLFLKEIECVERASDEIQDNEKSRFEIFD